MARGISKPLCERPCCCRVACPTSYKTPSPPSWEVRTPVLPSKHPPLTPHTPMRLHRDIIPSMQPQPLQAHTPSLQSQAQSAYSLGRGSAGASQTIPPLAGLAGQGQWSVCYARGIQGSVDGLEMWAVQRTFTGRTVCEWRAAGAIAHCAAAPPGRPVV